MKLNNQKGFTMIELVLVIVILGILAVAALPSFVDLSTNAAEASRDGVVGAVRSGLGVYYANDIVNNPPANYPPTLDTGMAAGPASTTNRLFNNIIQNGIDDPNWSKTNDTTYVYTFGGVTTTYTYDPATGGFTAN